MTGELEAAAAALPETETLRDKMAMAALQGILGCPHKITISGKEYSNPNGVEIAAMAFALADAMMEARKK